MEQLLTVETRTVPALAGLESQFVMRRNRVTASWFPALISKRASMLRWDMPGEPKQLYAVGFGTDIEDAIIFYYHNVIN